MNTNINWTALIGLIATVVALFGLDIPADVQAKLVAGIDAVTFVIIWFLHTYVNHDVTDRKALMGFGRRLHTLLVFALGAALITPLAYGCSTIQDALSGAGKPIAQALVVGKDGQGAYLVLCSVTPKPAYCPDVATAKDVSGKFTSVAGRIVAIYETHGDTSALIVELQNAVIDIIKLQNDAKARSGKPGLSATEIITIVTTVIQVGRDLYADWKSIQGDPTDAQLDGWVAIIKGQNDRIQAM